MKMVLLNVRCGVDGCRRLIAEVGRDDGVPAGRLLVRDVGRLPNRPVAPGVARSKWTKEEHLRGIADPRGWPDNTIFAPLPLMCDRHESDELVLDIANLGPDLSRAEARGGAVDVLATT